MIVISVYGTVTLQSCLNLLSCHPMTVTGNYRFIGKKQIRMDFGGLLGSMVREVDISGNRLTLNGMKFERVE